MVEMLDLACQDQLPLGSGSPTNLATNMTDSSPSVSIVLPVFNRAGSIGAAVESVLRQTYTDFELLVVDDGSTDGSMAVLAEVTDPRPKLLANPEEHGGWCRPQYRH